MPVLSLGRVPAHPVWPRSGPFSLPMVDLQPEDAAAALHTSPFFIVIARLSRSQGRIAEELHQAGFVEVPRMIHDLLDLRGVDDFDGYLARLPKAARSNVRRAWRHLEQSGATCDVDDLWSLGAEELGRVHAEVILPACARRGVNPYGSVYESMFLSHVYDLERQGARLVRVRVGGRLAGAAVFSVRPSFGEMAGATWAWNRPLAADDVACEMLLCHVHATKDVVADSQLAASIGLVLWTATIRFALAQKIALVSGGRDPSPGLHFWNYLNVLDFKCSLGMTTASMFNERERVLVRATPGLFFASRQSARRTFREPGGDGVVQQHLVSGAMPPTLHRRIEAETAIRHEVVFASPREHGLAGPVLEGRGARASLWSLGAELGLAS